MQICDALVIAEKYIENNMGPCDGDRYVVIKDAMVSAKDGWYFPYQSKRCLDTGVMDFSLVGNRPIFVALDGSCNGGKIPTK
ncbi:hypothetical protein [Achromobacter ruhlandii]|uniref:hypothetical protein n=1 Tax=Achromobacter ruhlandii TaxID=72557 RepID=UPI003B9EAE0E